MKHDVKVLNEIHLVRSALGISIYFGTDWRLPNILCTRTAHNFPSRR